MVADGPSELCSILSQVKKLLGKYEKHTTTLYSLADQIKGMEGCEKDKMEVASETYSAVQTAIHCKMMEELQSLGQLLEEMDSHRDSVTSFKARTEELCQKSLEKGGTNMKELPLLQTTYSVLNHLTQLVAMKKVPLLNADLSDCTTLQDFKKINALTKPMEMELEVVLQELGGK